MPNYIASFNDNKSSDIFALQDLIKTKGKGWNRLKSVMPLLIHYFDNYPNLLSNKNYFPKIKSDSQTGKFLYNLYENERKAFKFIKNKRERAKQTLGCCPYCGLPGNLTLDHYLPRDTKRFPHYSIFDKNLVPACYGCQIAKSNFAPTIDCKTRLTLRRSQSPRFHQSRTKKLKLLRIEKSEYSQKQFSMLTQRIIHPYYDSFVKNPILFLTPFILDTGQIEGFTVKNCSAKQKTLLEFHLKKLNIASRSAGAIKRFKSVILKKFKNDRVYNQHDAIIALNNLLQEATVRGGGGKNYLEVVTIRSLFSDEAEIQRLIENSQKKEPGLIKTSVAKRISDVSMAEIRKLPKRKKLFQKS
jgi:hypothetical protein